MAIDRPTNWWTTVPGMLMALAAVITAGTGLMLGLHQMGLIGASKTDTPSGAVSQGNTPNGGGVTSTSNTSSPATSGRSYQVTLPYKQEIRSGDLSYEILEATTRPETDGKLALTLSVRARNYDRFDSNFWDSTFRLSVGEGTYPASGGLDELVAGDASKIGNVLFVIPDSTRAATLKIKFHEGDRTIPFELRPS
jgi:hypothetical protein